MLSWDKWALFHWIPQVHWLFIYQPVPPIRSQGFWLGPGKTRLCTVFPEADGCLCLLIVLAWDSVISVSSHVTKDSRLQYQNFYLLSHYCSWGFYLCRKQRVRLKSLILFHCQWRCKMMLTWYNGNVTPCSETPSRLQEYSCCKAAHQPLQFPIGVTLNFRNVLFQRWQFGLCRIELLIFFFSWGRWRMKMWPILKLLYGYVALFLENLLDPPLAPELEAES